jgi:hypothetical protein
VARVNQALSGVSKYLVSSPSLVISATTYTPAQLQAALGAYPPAVTALQLQHAQLHTAVEAEKTQAAEVDELLSELEVFVINMFGPKAEQLTEFGFAPRKVTVLSAADKAAAKAKAKATREAKKAALEAATSGTSTTATPAASNGAPTKA